MRIKSSDDDDDDVYLVKVVMYLDTGTRDHIYCVRTRHKVLSCEGTIPGIIMQSLFINTLKAIQSHHFLISCLVLTLEKA
jgi:hypothetical protein